MRCKCRRWKIAPQEWESTPRWLVWLGKPAMRRLMLVSIPDNGECLDWWQYARPDN